MKSPFGFAKRFSLFHWLVLFIFTVFLSDLAGNCFSRNCLRGFPHLLVISVWVDYFSSVSTVRTAHITYHCMLMQDLHTNILYNKACIFGQFVPRINWPVTCGLIAVSIMMRTINYSFTVYPQNRQHSSILKKLGRSWLRVRQWEGLPLPKSCAM